MKSTEDTVPSHLGELLLLRLLSQSKGETPAAMEKVLRPLLKKEEWKSPEERLRAIHDELVALAQAGCVERLRKSSFTIVASGKRAITAALGLKSVPANANWRTLQALYFVMCVVQRLGAAPLVIAKKQAPLPADDETFAQRVLSAARDVKTGRFGDDKVFISHVAQQLDTDGYAIGDVDAFKNRLVAVHRGRFLSLSRADLVPAMNLADVTASETRYQNATFHFVNI
jgi:hypothetical protein